MSTLSQHWVQDYYDLRTVLVEANLITIISGTQTDTPTVTGTESIVEPDGDLAVTVTNYDSDNFYYAVASGTTSASGSDAYIWTAPSIAGEYDFSVYAVTTGEVLSDAGIWSIEVSGPEWASYFDNTHWTATTGSWDGVKWVHSGNSIVLTAIGTWMVDFRPTMFRINDSGTFLNLTIYGGATQLYTSFMYPTGVVVGLTFGVSDISSISVSSTSAYLSSIEFYG